jgi:transposase
MLADELDYVVGVDTHLDEHVLAVVSAATGAVLARRTVRANARGYQAALRFAGEAAHGARAWAVEGTGSYGAGLTRYLAGRGETVLEVSRPRGPSDACAAKTTRSTRHGQRGQRLPARRSRFRVTGNDARRYGCYWSHVAAPSTCAAKRSDNFAA